MLQFILRRLVFLIPTLIAITVVMFVIIQLPPGDYLTTLVAAMASTGEDVDPAALTALKERYGLGQPIYVQYWKWISGIVLRGDFGRSFAWNMPVSDLIWERLTLTFVLSLATLLFIWIVSFPVGVYSAVRQYSVGDYVATFFGFLGVAIPNFLLALVLMYIAFKYFNQSVGGLFSPEYQEAPWSLAKVGDLIAHLWIPIIIIGTDGTAGLIRIMRANLLDELRKPYVVTARCQGIAGMEIVAKIPSACGAEPLYQHRRLGSSRFSLRFGNCGHCAQLTHNGTAVIASSVVAGYVFGSKFLAHAKCTDGDRDTPLRPALGLVGSTNSV